MDNNSTFNINDLFTPASRTEKYAVVGFGPNGTTIYGKNIYGGGPDGVPTIAEAGSIVPFHPSEVIPWQARPKAEKGARLCPAGTDIQTLIFSKEKYDLEQAKDWAWEHDFNASVDEKDNTYRMRQQHPSKFKDGSFRTIPITDGIKAVIGCPVVAEAGTGAAYWIALKPPMAEHGAKTEEKGFMVFNYTDNIYASNETFATKKEANDFIKTFRKRFEKQGYYRDNRMQKIDLQDIDLLAIPADFSPYKTAARGGRIIEFSDGYKFKAVSEEFAKKNWKKENIYRIDTDEESEALVQGEDDLFDGATYGVGINSTAARGGKVGEETFTVDVNYQSTSGNPLSKRITVQASDEDDAINKANQEVKKLSNFSKIVGGDVVNTAAKGKKLRYKKNPDAIAEDEFYSKYKPEHNKFELKKQPGIDPDSIAPFGGTMYETYGEEYDYISKMSKDPKTEKRVWTIVSDDNGDLVISAGWHYVNRHGYMITEKPWKTGGEYVVEEFSKGGRIRDRKYTSEQPHEKRYKLKRKSRVLRYKKN